jgi:hypothetical protein
MSTARWRGSRCCSAATNASRIDSRDTARSSGSSVCVSRLGIGWIHVVSGSGAPRWSVPSLPTARSMGMARPRRSFSASMQTLVAILYAHARSPDGSARPGSARHARTMVSWTASSASCGDPSIR